MDQINVWLESPSPVLLGETEMHWSTLQALLVNDKTVVPALHDALIAALCLQQGVRELWSADRDFRPGPQDQWNCSSSVEPVNAVSDDAPPWMAMVTSSKYPVPTSCWWLTKV